MDSIAVNDFKKLNNINIIDIRSKEKYNNNHILNATHIEFEKLLINPSLYLNKNEKYYIYCQTGLRSIKLCRILKNNGFDVINIIGGYEAWILEE